MIIILTNQAVFVTLSVVTIPPLAQGIFILTLNQADVIGDQLDAVTQNVWFCCALCAAISGEISVLIQTKAESWGRFPVPRICRWESTVHHEVFTASALEAQVRRTSAFRVPTDAWQIISTHEVSFVFIIYPT